MAANTKPSYNEAVLELQDILSDIDAGETDIDELAAKVKRASFLIDYCKKKLTKTETDIQKIIQDSDKK